jgi:hypothetical protein
MLALGGVQCDHVNSLRDELRTPPWMTLLRRAGEFMCNRDTKPIHPILLTWYQSPCKRHTGGPCLQQLLGRTMLLRPLHNGSYLQVRTRARLNATAAAATTTVRSYRNE